MPSLKRYKPGTILKYFNDHYLVLSDEVFNRFVVGPDAWRKPRPNGYLIGGMKVKGPPWAPVCDRRGWLNQLGIHRTTTSTKVKVVDFMDVDYVSLVLLRHL